MVVEGDKNVGGCILHRDTYMHRGVREHLVDQNVYQPLDKNAALRRMCVLRYKYDVFISKWYEKGQLSAAEKTFLLRARYLNPTTFARFRMSLKAHKNPWKMRPIVCCVGTFINYLSQWLDHWLQKLKPFMPSFLKDGNELLHLLHQLGSLPPGVYKHTY